MLIGKAQLTPRIIVGDWPSSSSRRKYLTLVTTDLSPESIYVYVGEDLVSLASSPQRRFFAELAAGAAAQQTAYIKNLSRHMSDIAIADFIRDKTRLWADLQRTEAITTPAVSFITVHKFVVEDGAHRLAALTELGHTELTVGISIWSIIKKSD